MVFNEKGYRRRFVNIQDGPNAFRLKLKETQFGTFVLRFILVSKFSKTKKKQKKKRKKQFLHRTIS